jgi:predicted porin
MPGALWRVEGGAMKRLLQSWVFATVAGVALLAATGAASAADVTDADRVFQNYTRETATVAEHQVRLEVRGLKEQTDDTARLNLAGQHLLGCAVGHPECAKDLDTGIIDLVGSYGLGKNAEVGFILPGMIESLRVTEDNVTTVRHDADLGDIQLYTKFKREVAQHCAVGAGVELSLPNGSRAKGFGTGEFGVNPFGSTRYQRGPFAVGGNVGYQMYTGDARDVFNYGAELILRLSEEYAVRTELAGRLLRQGSHYHDLTILPGVDVNVSENLVVRPTGLVGVSPSAADWGIGIGVAVIF